jgi:hypothetical protein
MQYYAALQNTATGCCSNVTNDKAILDPANLFDVIFHFD